MQWLLKSFVQDVGKAGDGGEGGRLLFSQQWQQWSGSGSAMIGGDGGSGGGGGEFGDREGCRSAVQRLAFYIVGQLGIKVLCAAE